MLSENIGMFVTVQGKQSKHLNQHTKFLHFTYLRAYTSQGLHISCPHLLLRRVEDSGASDTGAIWYSGNFSKKVQGINLRFGTYMRRDVLHKYTKYSANK